jgi:hypothetical protein
MNKILIPFLLLITGFFLPLTLWGQEMPEDTLSSIHGQVFKYGSPPPPFPPSTTCLSVHGMVTMVSNGDTLRVEAGTYGIFSVPEIASGQVSIIEVSLRNRMGEFDGRTIPILLSFELMPGENIMLIPVEDFFETMPSANYSIVTMEGDDWIFHYPSDKGIGLYAADKLKDFPGTKYNRRNETITIPKDGIYRAYVDGAYIFALDPSSSK